ncbi:hypothetical protein [Shewanella surugensis]|uniref:Phospholipase D N-terminal domain-containing protein n=1 Tax=Shewanella surugensis TaxID=212020 RepID=A0ABT0LBH4_9GAMM|nr:hypothetical protein [Shewanella surugensis]MCL1125048.1 hypothetical protein [Shewanella surugensis]
MNHANAKQHDPYQETLNILTKNNTNILTEIINDTTLQSTVNEDIILGQATDSSITVNLLVEENSLIYCEYGIDPDNLFNHTSQITATTAKPVEIELSSLTNNTRYYYRIIQQADGQ